MRLETGKTRCGEDWPGVFIRGDNALAYAAAIRALLNDADNNLVYPPNAWLARSQVEELAKLLESSHARNDVPEQVVSLEKV